MMWTHCLFARLPQLGEVSRSATNRPTASFESNWYLLFVVLGIAALWVGLYYWDRIRQRLTNREETPESLFRGLCATHRLSRMERNLLERVVERKNLEHPAIVFVVPGLLREMTDGPYAAEYAQLAKKLFGAHA